MLATAAVADSSWKEAKREALDRAITQVKVEVKDLDIQHQSRLAALPNKPSQEEVIKETKGAHWGDVFEWASRQKEVRKALGFQDWKGIPLDLLEGLSRSDIQRALEDSRIFARLSGEASSAPWNTESHSRPLSQKKLRTLEWSVAKLIARFLSQIPNDRLMSTRGLEQPEGTLQQQLLNTKEDLPSAISKIDERLLELQKYSQRSELPESFESPQYPRYGAGSENDPTSLNTTLRTIVNGPESRVLGKDSILAKICYNLMMSTTPPNIHTYNTLLIKFCHTGEQDIVSAVLTSMRESHIRPNEVTHSTTLKFFTLVQNSEAFAKYVRLMEGLDQGLALAHPKTKRIPITAGRYRFSADQQKPVAQFALDEDGAPVSIDQESDIHSSTWQTKIFEKARVNVQVYGALIHGSLQFWGKEQAMQFYRAMISEGWHPNVNILTSLLRHCCYNEDWVSGVAVWQELQRLARGANESAYLWMLRLCRRCEKQNKFEEVLKHGTQRGVLPLAVWDLGAQIKTAEVNTLIDTAKRIRDTQPSRQKQLAARKHFRVGFNAEQQSNAKTTLSVEVLEPSENEMHPGRPAIHPADIVIEHQALSPAMPTSAPPSQQYQLIPEPKTSEPIAFDRAPPEVPALNQSKSPIPPPRPTTSGSKELAQGPPPNSPMVSRKDVSPQMIPAHASWPTHGEALTPAA